MALTPEERITKAKIKLQKERPFWAYLAMHVEAREAPELVPTMGVRQNSRYIYYNPEFVASLTMEQLKAAIAHEIVHLASEHPARTGNRNPQLANIAADLWANAVLVKDGFQLPEGGLIPQGDSVTIDGLTIDKLSQRSFEEIYDLLKSLADQARVSGFDDHSHWPESDGQGDSGEDNDEGLQEGQGSGEGQLPDRQQAPDSVLRGQAQQAGGQKSPDWAAILAEAAQYAKQQGKLPAGLERWVEAAAGRRIDWRALLESLVLKMLPQDYTFARPSRRSATAGSDVYLPSVKKENLEIGAVIDTSGSISQDDLAEFKGLLIRLVKSFESVVIHIMISDAEVHDQFDLDNGSIQRFREMALRGCGGTDFRPALARLEREHPSTRLVVFFTDGYGSFPEKEPPFQVIWLLQPPHVDEAAVPFGRVISLERYPLGARGQ